MDKNHFFCLNNFQKWLKKEVEENNNKFEEKQYVVPRVSIKKIVERAEVHEGRRGSRRCPARVGVPARAGPPRHRPEWFLDHRRAVQPDGGGSPRLRGAGVGETRRHGCDGADLDHCD